MAQSGNFSEGFDAMGHLTTSLQSVVVSYQDGGLSALDEAQRLCSKGNLMTRQRHYSVFGGPDGRSIASVALGATKIRAKGKYRGRVLPYEYVLVDAPDGTQAFVPRRNTDLTTAFSECEGSPGEREWDTLAAEMERRGLAAQERA
jgi:hypothetical protein